MADRLSQNAAGLSKGFKISLTSVTLAGVVVVFLVVCMTCLGSGSNMRKMNNAIEDDSINKEQLKKDFVYRHSGNMAIAVPIFAVMFMALFLYMAYKPGKVTLLAQQAKSAVTKMGGSSKQFTTYF